MSRTRLRISVASIVLLGVAALAQEARVPVKVSPHFAYIFLDGMAVQNGDTVLKTTAGEHTIAVFTYGYQGEVRKLNLSAGKNEKQSFTLQPKGAPVGGPFGYIQIEGPVRAAVLLNGTTPEYCVGHVDMFNNHIGWSQQLLVPPGIHQVTVTQKGKTFWQGPIDVREGERVIVWTSNGRMARQTVEEKANAARPRAEVGIASAKIAIAPVSGTLAANPSQVNCHEPAKLVYGSQETLESGIKVSRADAAGTPLPERSGEVAVEPKQTTLYNYYASGPGGQVNQFATVKVDPTVHASLEATPAEIHYLKVGDTVLAQEGSVIKWNTTNADTASLDPVGNVQTSGSQQVTPAPKEVNGEVYETRTYTLTASNECGGSQTTTAQVQIKGMIEPQLLSVFFPTAYPGRDRPDVGLVASQEERLLKLVEVFPLYAANTPDAKILVEGYTDPRGKTAYNIALSERRVNLVKAFLVSHGIAEDKITVDPKGEEMASIPNAPNSTDENQSESRAAQLAYNRRTDIVLQPANLVTARILPSQSSDAEMLVRIAKPGQNAVIAAQPLPPPENVEAGK